MTTSTSTSLKFSSESTYRLKSATICAISHLLDDTGDTDDFQQLFQRPLDAPMSMNEIVPNLWVGDLPSALKSENLRAHNIRSVLSAMRGRVSIHEVRPCPGC